MSDAIVALRELGTGARRQLAVQHSGKSHRGVLLRLRRDRHLPRQGSGNRGNEGEKNEHRQAPTRVCHVSLQPPTSMNRFSRGD